MGSDWLGDSGKGRGFVKSLRMGRFCLIVMVPVDKGNNAPKSMNTSTMINPSFR